MSEEAHAEDVIEPADAPAADLAEEEWAEVVARSNARRAAYEAEQTATKAEREKHFARGAGRIGEQDAPRAFAPPRELPIKVLSSPQRERLYVVPPPPERDVDDEIRRTIPEAFHDVTWANLASLRRADGQPSLGAVLDQRGKLVRGAAAVRELQRRIAGTPKVILLGDTGAGKTLAACAALEDVIRASAGSRAWVHVGKLKEADTLARALSTRALWIDDVGWELNGAKPDSGWIPGLRGPFQDFIGQWALRRNGRLVITTALNEQTMAQAYNVGVARRLYEGADVIELFRDA